MFAEILFGLLGSALFLAIPIAILVLIIRSIRGASAHLRSGEAPVQVMDSGGMFFAIIIMTLSAYLSFLLTETLSGNGAWAPLVFQTVISLILIVVSISSTAAIPVSAGLNLGGIVALFVTFMTRTNDFSYGELTGYFGIISLIFVIIGVLMHGAEKQQLSAKHQALLTTYNKIFAFTLLITTFTTLATFANYLGYDDPSSVKPISTLMVMIGSLAIALIGFAMRGISFVGKPLIIDGTVVFIFAVLTALPSIGSAGVSIMTALILIAVIFLAVKYSPKE